MKKIKKTVFTCVVRLLGTLVILHASSNLARAGGRCDNTYIGSIDNHPYYTAVVSNDYSWDDIPSNGRISISYGVSGLKKEFYTFSSSQAICGASFSNYINSTLYFAFITQAGSSGRLIALELYGPNAHIFSSTRARYGTNPKLSETGKASVALEFIKGPLAGRLINYDLYKNPAVVTDANTGEPVDGY